MKRRKLLGVAGSSAVGLLAGCLEQSNTGEGGNSNGPDEGQRQNESDPSTEPQPDSESTADTQSQADHAAQNPEPDHDVRLSNDFDEPVEMRTEVIRDATEETVYDEVHSLQPGEETTVYNTRDAEPDGIEQFTVVVTARGASEQVGLETNGCYGGVSAWITDDGDLSSTYAIC
jgi:hypothetical protein